MNPLKRFEDAIQVVCQRHPDRTQRNQKLLRIREAIQSYRSRVVQAYEASRSSWERTHLLEAKNRLQMMLDRIRILCSEGPETA